MSIKFCRVAAAAVVLLTVSFAAAAQNPVVFRASQGVGPGNVVLLSGGGLGEAKIVRYWRLDDVDPGEPDDQKQIEVPRAAAFMHALQPRDGSLKFSIPPDALPGVYGAMVLSGTESARPILINRPEVWFLQPTVLQPGLDQNQAPAGAVVQIIGKSFLIPKDQGEPRIALRPAAGGKWTLLKAAKAESYSLIVELPKDLASGAYELRIHSGFGGPDAWSAALKIEIKAADVWPGKIFNVKDAGAAGDDVHDDTPAIKKTLQAAEDAGGGVVYFPYGTYRLNDWICLPPRTVLRGEGRDISILKWPVDEPKKPEDFTPAAIYGASPYGVEDLTLIVRKVDTAFLDLSYENVYAHSAPAELGKYVKPWGEHRDVFFRRVHFQHWIDCSHPERDPDLAKKLWGSATNLAIGGMRNLEISDCIFQGADQKFNSIRNARITGDNFSNMMNSCWTELGGGAHFVVCENNEINCASSWGWGWTGMQYVYSAHNISRNFVRGEREAMTLDISSLPTARPVWQYWGTPVEVVNTAGKVSLKFPPPSQASPDGFHTGFTPGCFKGGSVTIHAYTGGPGANQTRQIIDNTADTVLLDKPWNTPPDTQPRKLYLEVAPRHARAHIGTTAWIGKPATVGDLTLTAEKAEWIPDEFIGMTVLILDGPGAGQYRVITANSSSQVTLDRAWDVAPTAASTIGIWSLMRHMIVYDSQGFDTSAFAQLYGNFYDYTVDRCHVERSQGIWGQGGWYVSLLNNDVSVGYSYHPGIGPGGNNPEKCSPFGVSGLLDGNLRITKSNAYQYGIMNKAVFVNDVLSQPVPGVLGATARGNVLRYNQRIAFQLSTRDFGYPRAVDVIIDSNTISHSPVGIQIGPDVMGAVVSGNHYVDVAQPHLLAKPEHVVDADPEDAGLVGK